MGARNETTFIRWLHLTDLHMGAPRQKWMWPFAKDRLFEDLETLCRRLPIDLVLFTGDLAYSGGGSPASIGPPVWPEYANVNDVLDKLWDRCFSGQETLPVLLAVPGNHDLRWPSPTDPVVKVLERWHDDPDVERCFWDDCPGSVNPYRATVASAYAPYAEWWNTAPYRPAGIRDGLLPGDFSFTFIKNGWELGFVGLSSAFLQLTDKDQHGRVVVGLRQLNDVCGSDWVEWANAHHGCVLLTHHPLQWLHPSSQSALAMNGLDKFYLHLCGHLHVPESLEILSGGQHRLPLQWIGRSLFGLEHVDQTVYRTHGYTIGELACHGRPLSGTLWFRPRAKIDHNRVWDLGPDPGPDGLLDRLGRTKPRKIKLRTPVNTPLIAPWEWVFHPSHPHPRHGQAFASELLTRPIVLRRTGGKTTVTIDRQGAVHGVFNTAGKNELVRHDLGSKAAAKWARETDERVHEFMSGHDDAEMTIELNIHMRMRWCSGGVLPVVHFQGERERALWTPFFFRDIQPIGWNLALGASESVGELNHPNYALLREFLEEILVLPYEPVAGLRCTPRVFLSDNLALAQELCERAEEFSDEHLELRNRADGLNLEPARWSRETAEAAVKYRLADSLPVDLHIIDRDTRRTHHNEGLLVCFNLTELAAEVIQVYNFELAPGDYLLDGEIAMDEDKSFIVRQPVALISHDYLRRVFGEGVAPKASESWDIFQKGSREKERVEMPSVRPSEAPKFDDDEIRLFDWDVKRLCEISASAAPGQQKAKDFVRNYYDDYFKKDDKGKYVAAFPLFTPAAAKALTYYFGVCG